MTDKQRHALLIKHASAIVEHFDSVQILATREDGGSTRSYAAGRGNYYARRGSVEEWLTREQEETRVDVWPEDFDSGEDWKGAGI